MTELAFALAALFALAFGLASMRAAANHRRAQQEFERAQRDGAAAQAAIAQLTAALAGASEGLVVIDPRGALVATNPAAVELVGLPATDLRGRRVEDLLPWPALPQALAASRRHRRVETFELASVAGQGRQLMVRVTSLGEFGAVVGIDDQSRLKALESLRRDFVANVSHELKTPLAAIQGYVETMIDDPAMPEATRQRFLDRMARQSERLATLVADLLTLSRLDEELRVEEAVDPCDFGNVLGETTRDLQPLAEKRQLVFDVVRPEHGVWVRAEREALRQVAGNLIDNAIKYTPNGGRVSVRLTCGDGLCKLEVVDTGIGLSPADQERVFERFYRVDRARSRDLGGTGLGLSIVKNTVKRLGGEVGVDSALGKGSTFWVELPCADGAGSAEA